MEIKQVITTKSIYEIMEEAYNSSKRVFIRYKSEKFAVLEFLSLQEEWGLDTYDDDEKAPYLLYKISGIGFISKIKDYFQKIKEFTYTPIVLYEYKNETYLLFNIINLIGDKTDFNESVIKQIGIRINN